jgi:hypothetical protein
VSEHFLYRPQVGPLFEEVGSERMTKGMREGGRPFPDDAADTARCQRATPHTHPQMIAGGRPGQDGSAHRKISIHGFPGGSSERNRAFTVPFAGYAHEFPIAYLIDPQLCQLGDANPGGVEDFEYCPISEHDRFGSLQRLQDLPDRPLRERVRQRLWPAASGNLIRRIEKDLSATSLVCEKDPDGRGLPGYRAPRIPEGVEICDESPDRFAIHVLHGADPGPIAECHELAQIPAIGIQRVWGQIAL